MQASDIKGALSVYSLELDDYNFFISKGIPQSERFEINKDLFRTGFHVIGLCTGGSMCINIDFRAYHITPFTFMSVAPASLVRLVSKSKDFKVLLLLFEQSFLLKQAEGPDIHTTLSPPEIPEPTYLHLNEEQAALITPLFRLIKEKSVINSPYRDDIIRHLILALLYQCADFQNSQLKAETTPARQKEIKNNFIALVRQHCKEHRNVDFYAGKLYITPKHLTDTLKTTTGKTAKAIIDESVILEAKLLLNDLSQSIQAIAEALHFGDQAVFSKFFRKHCGISPTGWRKR